MDVKNKQLYNTIWKRVLTSYVVARSQGRVIIVTT